MAWVKRPLPGGSWAKNGRRQFLTAELEPGGIGFTGATIIPVLSIRCDIDTISIPITGADVTVTVSADIAESYSITIDPASIAIVGSLIDPVHTPAPSPGGTGSGEVLRTDDTFVLRTDDTAVLR